MKRLPWVPIYVSDYLADTTHLSTVEHGAYFLLILDYWRNGGLPSDKAQLARIARLTPKEWSKIAGTISSLFGPNWSHKRLNSEIDKAVEISKKRRDAVGKRQDRRPTFVPSFVPTNVPSIEDTSHTSHFTQGSKPGDEPPVEDEILGGRAGAGAETDHDGEDVFGSRGAA